MAHRTDFLVDFLIGHRRAVLTFIAVLTVGLGFFITRIEVDNDPTQNIPDDLPAYVTYRRLQEAFPSPRNLLVLARFPDTSLSLAQRIAFVSSLGERFEAIDGIFNVMHLGALRVPVRGGFVGITSGYVVPPEGEASDSLLRSRILASADFTAPFISPDETVLGMIMSVDDAKNQVRVVSEAVRVRGDAQAEGVAEVVMTGAALYAYSIDEAMRRDFMILLPLCVLVVFILLLLVLRRVTHVIASLAVTGIALIWTFGLMGITGMPFSVVTSMIPVILLPIGVASAIHIFKTCNRNRQLDPHGDPLNAIRATFAELFRPILLSAITTFVGFISFSWSRVAWTRIFGIFTATGVALALLLSIVVLPIVLYYSRTAPLNALQKGEHGAPRRRVWAWWWRLYRVFTTSPVLWIVAALLIVVVGILGYLRVTVEGNPIGFFPPGTDVRRSDQLIEKYLGGTRFINIVLERSDSAITQKHQWEEIDAIATHVESFDIVGGSSSLLVLVKAVSRMMTGEEIATPALAMILEGKGLLGRSFARFVDTWISPDRHRVKISLICRNVTGTRYSELTAEIDDYIRVNWPHYTPIVTGPPVLNDEMTFLLIETQRQSLVFAFVSVFLVLCLIFRSLKIGVFALFPIVLSTMFVYSLMGWLGVAINAVTIITVNTCIGIGIDYAIHFVSGYLYLRPRYGSRAAAIDETLRTRGAVIMGNTFVVGLGFVVLSFSTFPPIRHFGLFVCISMITSSVFALTFLPALIGTYGIERRRSAPD